MAAILNFTPSAYGQLAVNSGASSRVAVPGGGGATLVVTNLGPAPAVVLLGDSTVAVSTTTGMAVTPGHSVALAVGSNGYIAGIGTAGLPAILNLAQGT